MDLIGNLASEQYWPLQSRDVVSKPWWMCNSHWSTKVSNRMCAIQAAASMATCHGSESVEMCRQQGNTFCVREALQGREVRLWVPDHHGAASRESNGHVWSVLWDSPSSARRDCFCWGIEWLQQPELSCVLKGNIPSAQDDIWDHLCRQKPENTFADLEDHQINRVQRGPKICQVRKRFWDTSCHFTGSLCGKALSAALL